MYPTPDTLRRHPHYARVLDFISTYFERPPDKLVDSPERLFGSVDLAAQRFYLTGMEQPGSIALLRRIRDGWPFKDGDYAISNYDHAMTLHLIPNLCRAAMLWPAARTELEIPIRWSLWRMTEPQLVRQRPNALLATNLFVTLRAAVMCEWVLNGKSAAARMAEKGFGTNKHQWGLKALSEQAFDEDDYPLFDVPRLGHLANTSRPAAEWLYRNFVGVIPPMFDDLPMRMLCVGNQTANNAMTAAVPDLDDDYRDANPMIGTDIAAWGKRTVKHSFARRIIRSQQKPCFDWLMVPDDLSLPDSYFAERPPDCRGSRKVGPWTIEEPDENTSLVTFTPNGRKELPSNAERLTQAVTVRIKKEN